MLAEQRRQQILQHITSLQVAQIQDLSAALGVSVATIRRDLNKMESAGLIKRVHGGAMLPHNDSTEPPAIQRAARQTKNKRLIGQAAAALVNDGESIILTSGTTTEAMIPYLAPKNRLTVITNAINIAYKLARYPHIAVIVLGGSLRHSELSLLGHLTEEATRDLRASKLFHGTFGIDSNDGLTGTHLLEVQADRRIMAIAQEVIILADHTKFHQRGSVRLAPIEAINTIITDAGAPGKEIKALRDRGVQVIIASPAKDEKESGTYK